MLCFQNHITQKLTMYLNQKWKLIKTFFKIIEEDVLERSIFFYNVWRISAKGGKDIEDCVRKGNSFLLQEHFHKVQNSCKITHRYCTPTYIVYRLKSFGEKMIRSTPPNYIRFFTFHFLMVISEDQWHLHLMPRIMEMSLHAFTTCVATL